METALDIAFIGYDIYDIATNGLNWENGLSLAADVVCAIVPVVAGGGLIVRAAMHADDAVKAVKTVDKVVDTSKVIDKALDSAKSVDKAVDKLADAAKVLDDIPCSFNADTSVTTLDGQTTIDAIEVGDYVLAWNETEGTIGYYEVTNVLNHADPVLTELIIDGEWLETTPEHPFYTQELGWVPAGELQPGMKVRKADGSYGLVWLKWTVYRTQEMYNLTVADAHTYFVGDGQWLVHNTCPIGTQKHHLLPKSLENLPIVQLAKPSGWQHNGAMNIMQLPSNPVIAKQMGLLVHAFNKNHRVYNTLMRDALNDMFNIAIKQSWSSSQAKLALFNKARQIRWQIWKTGKLIGR